MNNLDQARELDKVIRALVAASNYLCKTSEANAQLHLSDKVLYTPLATTVSSAIDSAIKVRNEIYPGSDQ